MEAITKPAIHHREQKGKDVGSSENREYEPKGKQSSSDL